MGTTTTAGPSTTKEAAAEEPPPLDDELIGALKQALEDLFADQAVVTMRDVRLWLQSYTANVKARMAALQTDSTLSRLLLGGGSVVEIRYVSSFFVRCPCFWGMMLGHVDAVALSAHCVTLCGKLVDVVSVFPAVR